MFELLVWVTVAASLNCTHMSNINNETVYATNKDAALFTNNARNVNFEIVLLPHSESTLLVETENHYFQHFCNFASIKKRMLATWECRQHFRIFLFFN